MGKKKTSKITGFNISGKKRVYVFNLMNPWESLGVFHEYASLGLTSIPAISDILEQISEITESSESTGEAIKMIGASAMTGDGVICGIAKLIPQLLPFQRLQKLAGTMLPNVEITIGEAKHTADDTGMCDLFGSNPTELYAALFWAVVANYPRQLDPFLEALTGDEGEDLSQNSEAEKETENDESDEVA